MHCLCIRPSSAYMLFRSIMELHLSRSTLLNTVLRDERGNPIYRIESPQLKASGRTVTITRFSTESNSSTPDRNKWTGSEPDAERICEWLELGRADAGCALTSGLY